MDTLEIGRHMKKKFFDINYKYRRLFFAVVIVFALIWLFGFRLLSWDNFSTTPEPGGDCLSNQLRRFNAETSDLSANILHNPPLSNEKLYLPYVGNGYIGSAIFEEATIAIKSRASRVLNVPLPFRPMVRVSVTDEDTRNEAIVTQFYRGAVQQVSCIERGSNEAITVTSKFYTHRAHPSVFEQQVTIVNAGGSDAIVGFEQLGWTGDTEFRQIQKKTQLGEGELSYILASGVIEHDKKFIGVAIAYNKVPNAVEVKSRSTWSPRFITVVNYVNLASRKLFEGAQMQALINKSETELKIALSQSVHNFQSLHEKAWEELWTTGFYISPSLAPGALNGDKINATIYYVLSQVRAPLLEANVPKKEVEEASAVLSYTEGCYSGHHTLQAASLWTNLRLESEVLSVANLWLLTLYQMGCYKILRAGASGVIQGMVLSFGSFKFSNHHLEFNTEPKDLHRDYHFRRIGYGNATHVNISVTVGSDNKASLFVALDRSDKDYYACDAGCLDTPIELGPGKRQFPVKLTDPVTSLLYITSDRQHIEELRHTIHVKEVLEAPAHESHVISMHKHGSGYGTMSTMFWISISVVIILFHLFLFHLVYTEYFGTQEKFRSR